MRWDAYSLSLIGLFVFYQLMQWSSYPRFLDNYYHLLTVQGFEDAGGWSSVAFWEYAPEGRAQLYPPLLHFLLCGLRWLPISYITIAKLLDALLFPLFLCVLWRITRRLYDGAIAFWSLLLASQSYSFYLAVATLPAFTLGFAIGLAALAQIKRGDPLKAGLWLGLLFYAHVALAGIFLVASSFYEVVLTRRRTGILKMNVIAIALSSPYLLYLAAHNAYFVSVALKENRWLEFDPFVILCAILGLLFLVKQKNKNWLLPIGLLLAYVPALRFYPVRFISGQGLVPLFWLGGFFINHLFRRATERQNKSGWSMACFVFLIVFLISAPIAVWDRVSSQVRWYPLERTITRLAIPEDYFTLSRTRGHSIYFQKEFNEIASIITANSSPNDLIWSDFPHGAGILSLLTHRAATTGMLAEVKPFAMSDSKSSAKVLIYFKNREGMINNEAERDLKNNRVRLLAETSLAHVCLNPTATATKQIRGFIAPFTWIYAIVILIFLRLIF